MSQYPGGGPSASKMSRPQFDAATASRFLRERYRDDETACLVLDFREGVAIPPGDASRFNSVLARVERERKHLFFHVADLAPAWGDPASHAKGQVTSATKTHVAQCQFLWLDCDPEKYEGADPAEASAHYISQGDQVSQRIDVGLAALGIKPGVKWRSGAGWQALIRLDQPITSDEAEILVGKLHGALGFATVVKNANRILRVPGSVNWKNGKDGRVPAACTPCEFIGATTSIEHVRKALSDAGASTAAGTTATTKAVEFSPVSIDWSRVPEHADWLKSAADLPDDFPTKGRIIVGHSGTLNDLCDDLKSAGLMQKAYASWSDVTQALAAVFKAYGRFSPEQIAAALMCKLECNVHVWKQRDDAKMQRAVERAINRSYDSPAKRATRALNWRECRSDGSPLPSMFNARLAIGALDIECRHDAFHDKMLIGFRGDEVQHEIKLIAGEMTDHALLRLRNMVSARFGFDPGDKPIYDAVMSLALENCFDPVLDMLDAAQAEWDGVERLDEWVVTYLGCEDTPLNRAIGSKVLIAAVHRARNPGCKFDCITVLEGEEGTNKSMAIRVLAGDDNFSDQSILGARDKEVQEQLCGVWMHENADLAGMRRAEVEHVKAFASRQVDRARPAYGRVTERRPRRSIDWGTTNNSEYLQSQTGNRRFWTLAVGRIDIDALKYDRLLLLGEAAAREAEGESVTLDASLWPDAREAQEARRIKDPWEDLLGDIPEHVTVDAGSLTERTVQIIRRTGDGKQKVASADLLAHVLRVPTAQMNSSHGQRLALAMKHAKWQRNPTGKVTIDGVPVRGYWRLDPTDKQGGLALEYPAGHRAK